MPRHYEHHQTASAPQTLDLQVLVSFIHDKHTIFKHATCKCVYFGLLALTDSSWDVLIPSPIHQLNLIQLYWCGIIKLAHEFFWSGTFLNCRVHLVLKSVSCVYVILLLKCNFSVLCMSLLWYCFLSSLMVRRKDYSILLLFGLSSFWGKKISYLKYNTRICWTIKYAYLMDMLFQFL